MQLYYLGQQVGALPELTREVPPFRVDGIIVANAERLSAEEAALLAAYQRHGRPVGINAEEIAGQPRTNYAPINCNFYDHFEAAIVQRRTVDLAYRQADDSVTHEATRLRDLTTHLTEEYVQLDRGEWLRLDRVVSVDGAAAGASCRF